MRTEYNKTISNFENLSFENLSIPAKIKKINKIIEDFPDERKHDICESCRYAMGDLKQYNPYIQDGGTCTVCLQSTEVLNYSILELVERAAISFQDYYVYIGSKENEKNNMTWDGAHYGLRKYWNNAHDSHSYFSEKRKEQDIHKSESNLEKTMSAHHLHQSEYFSNKMKNLNFFQQVINILFIRL